jgi:hypothetical protein
MIGVRLEGGLGNQLFQYAAARSLAIRHCTEVIVDQSLLNTKKRSLTKREYELGNFNCIVKFPVSGEFKLVKLAKHLKQIFNLLTSWSAVIEEGDHLNEFFFIAPDNSYLIGYWQSYKYFEGIKGALVDEFTPKNHLSLESLRIKKVIGNSSPAIAVHVRRGDYVTLSSAMNFHGALPLDYYREGVKIMNNQFPGATYFIFSDDIAWCKEYLELNEGAVYLDHNSSDDAWQDLILMNACHHHIIANSSFSWWGAWLGARDQEPGTQKVIYPKNWFNGKVVNSGDRFPPYWLGI